MKPLADTPNPTRGIVISLADLTGMMAAPWASAGYEVILVDPQHPEGVNQDGLVTKVGRVLDHPETWAVLRAAIATGRVVAVFGFPVCTELAVSGTARWADKRAADPNFQARAMALVHECRVVGELSGAPWFFENPVSAISSIYRKPDHTFHPFEFGGYLPDDDEHPLYPEYFPPRDGYGKKTCLWSGGGDSSCRRPGRWLSLKGSATGRGRAGHTTPSAVGQSGRRTSEAPRHEGSPRRCTSPTPHT